MCCNRKHRLRERDCSGQGYGNGHGHRSGNCNGQGRGFGLNRRFISKSEKEECLKKYRAELVKEIAGIDEALSE